MPLAGAAYPGLRPPGCLQRNPARVPPRSRQIPRVTGLGFRVLGAILPYNPLKQALFSGWLGGLEGLIAHAVGVAEIKDTLLGSLLSGNPTISRGLLEPYCHKAPISVGLQAAAHALAWSPQVSLATNCASSMNLLHEQLEMLIRRAGGQYCKTAPFPAPPTAEFTSSSPYV